MPKSRGRRPGRNDLSPLAGESDRKSFLGIWHAISPIAPANFSLASGRKRTRSRLDTAEAEKGVVVPVDQGSSTGAELRACAAHEPRSSAAESRLSVALIKRLRSRLEHYVFSLLFFGRSGTTIDLGPATYFNRSRERTRLVGEVIGTGQSSCPPFFSFPGCALFDIELQFLPVSVGSITSMSRRLPRRRAGRGHAARVVGEVDRLTGSYHEISSRQNRLRLSEGCAFRNAIMP